MLIIPHSSNRQYMSSSCSLEDKTEDYQNCSVLYCVPQLYPIICTLIWEVLTAELGPVGLHSFFCFCVFFLTRASLLFFLFQFYTCVYVFVCLEHDFYNNNNNNYYYYYFYYYYFNAFLLPFSVLMPYCCTTVFSLRTTRTSFSTLNFFVFFLIFSHPRIYDG